MFSNYKYFSSGLSVIIHIVLFMCLLAVYRGTSKPDSSLIEIGFGGEPGGGSGGAPIIQPPVEEKIPTKETQDKKIKETEKPKVKETESTTNISGTGTKSGTGTGTGNGTGIGNGTESGTGKGNIGFPAPKVVPPKPVDETYYVAVEQMPEPIGGMESIRDKMPAALKGQGKGTVYVLVYIDENGAVRKVLLSKGIGGDADQAALNAIRRTRFKAGRKAGVYVRVQMMMGVSF
jgi:TonB family protein